MKFFGNGLVWDKENSKNLLKFVDGIFETSEDYIIKILQDLEYEFEEVEEKVEQAEKEIVEEVKKVAGKVKKTVTGD